ncbi:Pectinesterase, catalytic [Cinnamomum micranthum f. kanehirae]|uniref:Pectinesterase n=1 Tax=Cinnamomum micranthum f. kanehirae TaxID=337451 RepID=A0A443PU67_9MAGN|nr:Pectinesterase, catalytic [Cinnamomum micranthum f. kanehirae]
MYTLTEDPDSSKELRIEHMERIVVNRSFIFLHGEGRQKTFLESSDAPSTDKSTAFDIRADHFVAKNIAFKNNHNYALRTDANIITQAVAVRVRADKVAFYNCSFISVQDTIWDDSGRHLYQSCYIKGSVDYIFGAGQSHFENCILEQNGEKIQYRTGFITAQGRENWNDTNGFVFKNCTTTGSGKVFLGRAWRPYARVLFYNTYLSENVAPQGWVAWSGEPNVNNIVFAESNCYGPGSNTAGRVPWKKTLSAEELNTLTREGRLMTFLENSNASSTNESTTFDIIADNFVAKNIAFKNNHNYALRPDDYLITQAVAARVRADKVAFYNCSFISVQDTLWDDSGRHLYQSCYIKGSVDYVFGAGQSHFENCILEQNGGRIQYRTGFITAQGRENWNDTNGFVFKNCTTAGSGKVFLGRAWRPYARVLFYNTYLSENVAPEGWVAWYGEPNVNNIVFAESDCYGPGSNTSGRVPWEKTLSAEELNTLTRSRSWLINHYIYLLGEGQSSRVIVDSEASKTNESTTFDVIADNFVAKKIGFKVKKKIISLYLMIYNGQHLS